MSNDIKSRRAVQTTAIRAEPQKSLARRHHAGCGRDADSRTLRAPGRSRRSQPRRSRRAGKPNILVIFGDDIGQTNISAYSFGVMGYRTPNIDRIAKEGMMFTDYYAEQSCTAGRSSFITGQCTLRTGLSKVGIPGADGRACRRETPLSPNC